MKRLKKYAIPELNAWIFASNKAEFEVKKAKLLNRDKYNFKYDFNPRKTK